MCLTTGLNLLFLFLLIIVVSVESDFTVYSDADKPLQQSAQQLIFRAKELAEGRDDNLRLVVSFKYGHKGNVRRIARLQMNAIADRTVLAYLGAVIVEIKKTADIGHAVDVVKVLLSIPGAHVDADSIVFLSDELTHMPIRTSRRNTRRRRNRRATTSMYEVDDPLLPGLWGLNNINARAAWEYLSKTKSPNDYRPRVVVTGSGVDYTHPDLVSNIWTNPAESIGKADFDDDGNGYNDDIHGWNTAERNGDSRDLHGQGTYIAGIIGATANNTIGGAGVAPDVDIIGCKSVKADGWGYLSNEIACIDYAMAVNADVICNSWSMDIAGESYMMRNAIETMQRRRTPIFVAPAGSEGTDVTSVLHYIAADDNNVSNIINVAGTSSSNSLLRDSNFSNTVIHIAAPGEGIRSLTLGDINTMAITSSSTAAAGYVAGVVAMLKLLHPTATSQDVIRALKLSTGPFINSAQVVSWGGKLDALGALKQLHEDFESENYT